MPPTERSPEHTADNRPEDAAGTKRKNLRPAVVISVIAVIAVLASLVLFLRPAAGADTAAPAEARHVGRAGGGIASGSGRHVLQAAGPARRLTPGNGGTAGGECFAGPCRHLADQGPGRNLARSHRPRRSGPEQQQRLDGETAAGGRPAGAPFRRQRRRPPLLLDVKQRGRPVHRLPRRRGTPGQGCGPGGPGQAEHPAGGCRRDRQPHRGPGPLRSGPRRGYGQARRGDLRPEAAEHHGRQRAERIWRQWCPPGRLQHRQYVEELKAYANAINAVAPNVPISGPGAYDQKWWQPFIDADIPQKKILSFHNYPLYSCDGRRTPRVSPTIGEPDEPAACTTAPPTTSRRR